MRFHIWRALADAFRSERRTGIGVGFGIGVGIGFRIAAGSADEVRACLLVALAWGYCEHAAVAESWPGWTGYWP